jgi:hypothetical protein
MVPAESELVLVVNMATLRSSPWTQAAVAEALANDRGFNLFDQGFAREVDQVVFAMIPALGEGTSLLVATGHFQRATLQGLFQNIPAQETQAFYRGIELLERGNQALALPGARLVISGPTLAVRSAIDCGFAQARDIRSERWVEDLGDDLRVLDKAANGQESVAAYIRLSDRARQQLLAEFGDGDTLEQVGVRLHLGSHLHLKIIGVTRTGQEAVDFSARLSQQLQAARTRPLISLLGFGPVLANVKFAVSQTHILATLLISSSEQKEISRRMTLLSQMLARLHDKKSQEKANP